MACFRMNFTFYLYHKDTQQTGCATEYIFRWVKVIGQLHFPPLERTYVIQWMGGYMGYSVSLDALKVREVCAPAKSYTPVISAIA
jgi:hypothetical protein